MGTLVPTGPTTGVIAYPGGRLHTGAAVFRLTLRFDINVSKYQKAKFIITFYLSYGHETKVYGLLIML